VGHSCGSLGVFVCGDLLTCRADHRLIVEVGSLRRPGAVQVHLVFHIGHQIGYTCSSMVAGAAGMAIADRARQRIGAGTGGRPQAPGPWRVRGEPLGHGLSLLELVMIDHPRERRRPCGRLTGS
jgi:hypothetical protein